jgi:hypothetical protein
VCGICGGNGTCPADIANIASSKNRNNIFMYIIIGCGGGVLFLSIVIGITLIIKRNRKKSIKEDNIPMKTVYDQVR